MLFRTIPSSGNWNKLSSRYIKRGKTSSLCTISSFCIFSFFIFFSLFNLSNCYNNADGNSCFFFCQKIRKCCGAYNCHQKLTVIILFVFVSLKFDLTFPEVPCTLLSVDTQDISGEQHYDIVSSLIFLPIYIIRTSKVLSSPN